MKDIVISLTQKELKMRQEYNDYINNHILNVNKTWDILYEILKNDENLTVDLDAIAFRIHSHDESKRSPEEYPQYLMHYYADDADKNEDTEMDYKLAWLHHIHCNKHHWQHWILREDEGTYVTMNMDFGSIMEMLCDWHSFSAKDHDPDNTAYAWYYKNKDKILLSDRTRTIVEKYLEYLKEPL